MSSETTTTTRRGRIILGQINDAGRGTQWCYVHEDGRRIATLDAGPFPRDSFRRRDRRKPRTWKLTDLTTGQVWTFDAHRSDQAWALVVDLLGCGVMPHLGRQDPVVRGRLGQVHAALGIACLWPRHRSAGFYQANEH